MPRVRIASTGGTIASTSGTDEQGKTPAVSGGDLVDSIPELVDHAKIDVEEVCRVSGFQMDFEHLEGLREAVERAVADGVDGVVVTHGTDTMTESAYALALTLAAARDVPVVFTGAQRSFDDLGTDGPSNLVAAVRTAADERFREAGGVFLAFNDTVHAARRVVKAHTSTLETFESPGAGPIGEFTPAGLRLFEELDAHAAPLSGTRADPDVRVEIVTNALGVDGAQVERAVGADVDGLVVAGTGLGNTTGELGDALESAIDAGVAVVLTSRCHAGTTAGVYGGPGGGKTLHEAGAIAGGDLPPWKARLALTFAVAGDGGVENARTVFELEIDSK